MCNIILECAVPWQMMDTVKNIQSLISRVNREVQHCYREVNQVAHALAKQGIDNDALSITSFQDLPVSAKGSYRLDYIQMVSFRHKQKKNNVFL